MPPTWTSIPTNLLDQFSMQDMADQWAKDQYAKLGDDWADQQQMSAPPSSDSLTNPLGTGNGPAAPPEPAAGASAPPSEPSVAAPPPAAPAPAASTTPFQPPADVQSSQISPPLADSQLTPPSSGDVLDRNGVINYVHQQAAKYGLDPAAVLAVANQEGLNTDPGSHWTLAGEKNISFGPPSWYGNGAGSAIIAQHGNDAARWSWTPEGIDYWLGQVAQAAKGLAGTQAIAAIVNGFERPREDLAAGEIKKAQAQYDTFARPTGDGSVSTASSSGAAPPPGPPDQGNNNPVGDFFSGLGTAAHNVGSAAVQAVSPGGAVFNAAGAPNAALTAGEQALSQHAIPEALQTIADLTQQYPDPRTKGLTPDIAAMTPEDQQRYASATIAVGGIVSSGANFDKYGVEEGFTPPAAKQVSSAGAPSPDLAAPETTRLEPEVAASIGEQPTPAAQPSTDTLQGLSNMAQQRGVQVDDWQTQLNNLRQTDAYQNASRGEQQSMVADAQAQFQAEQQAAAPAAEAPTNVATAANWTPEQEARYQALFGEDTGAPVGSPASANVPPANPMQNVAPNGSLQPGVQNIPGRQGGAVPPGQKPSLIISANQRPPAGPSPEIAQGPSVPARAGITPDTVAMAHQRIDRAIDIGQPANQAAHNQLDQMLAAGAAPDEIARFLSTDVERKTAGPLSVLRTVRTGAMAGGVTTEGKVALSPVIQTAMRAPVGALKAIVRGQPGDIVKGLQGGLGGLAEGAADALQTIRYGTNYRAALTGGAQGGYGFSPGIDVLGQNGLQRAAGTAALGLVRTHGAIADISAGIGRGANAALGATPEAAAEAGQQWALRSGNYGTIGQTVANAFEGIRQTNPAMDVVGQILMPFYRVGYNAMTQGIERSPVGLVGTGIDVARGALGNGPYAAGAASKAVTPLGDRLANNLFGVGLAALGFTAASNGIITGEHPANGAPAWSVRVGGQWIPLRTLGPAQEALAQSAALYEAARDGKGNIPQIAEQTAQAYVGHVYDESWLRSVADTLGIVGDVKDLGSANPQTAASANRDLQYQAGSLGKSFVPQSSLIGQAAKAEGTPDLASTLLQAAGMAHQGRAARPSRTSDRAVRPSR